MKITPEANNKLLVLDGISGVPLGKELAEALQDYFSSVVYADLKVMPVRRFYGLRAVLIKSINRIEDKDNFYHFPKLDENRFEAYLKKTQPTHILVIGFVYKSLSPSFLSRLKHKYNFRLYLYDTDSCNLYAKRREFIFFMDVELGIYHHIFSFSKVTTQFFSRTRKLSASFLPFGANPILTQRPAFPKNDVLFIGSADLRRIFLLEQIQDKVKIFGNRWSRNFPLISDGLKNNISDTGVWGEALYQQLVDAKIVLNITRTQFYGAETGVNLRIFEALAAGCFLLTDYCDEIEELFEIGVEIEVFRSSKELVEKVNYYLSHPEQRDAIALAGHHAFLDRFTWKSCARVMSQNIISN